MIKSKMRLDGVSTLVADDDQHAVALLQQMLRGMGMDRLVIVKTGADARAELQQQQFDLCLLEASLPDMPTSELIKDIRGSTSTQRFVPIVLMSSYTSMRSVVAARDAGASLVIKKPVSPQILFDRIAWAASSGRSFVEGGFYAGPDRRFKFIGPPSGTGRRESDLSAEIGDATEPNMSQSEIDALMKPTRVVPI